MNLFFQLQHIFSPNLNEKVMKKLSSPEIHYFRSCNISRQKGLAPFAYDHGVRKKTRLLKKERRRFFFMNYEYKVFKAKSALFLGKDLDTYGRYG